MGSSSSVRTYTRTTTTYYSSDYVLISSISADIKGYPGRAKFLYHATSIEAALAITSSGRMYRGSSGMFGGGIYFARTKKVANHKSRANGAIIEAYVTIGVSLICRYSRPHMNYRTLKYTYDCDSVKAIGCVTKKEYVVYNWSQVYVIGWSLA